LLIDNYADKVIYYLNNYLFTGVYEEGVMAKVEVEFLLGRVRERFGGLGNDGVQIGGEEPLPYDVGLCGGSEGG